MVVDIWNSSRLSFHLASTVFLLIESDQNFLVAGSNPFGFSGVRKSLHHHYPPHHCDYSNGGAGQNDLAVIIRLRNWFLDEN